MIIHGKHVYPKDEISLGGFRSQMKMPTDVVFETVWVQ